MSASEHVIEIDTDGSCVAIYDDDQEWHDLGGLRVIRLSDVEFDAERQGWVVRFRNGVTLPDIYPKRAAALAAEVAYANEHLAELAAWARQREGATN